MPANLIYCHQVTRFYPLNGVEIRALNGVDLSIERGEMVAVMGASGSGKSTLMNILGCMDRLSSGEYMLDGIDVNSLNDDALAGLRNRKIGFVFQRYNLLARMTALQNVMLPLLYAGISKSRAGKKALEIMEQIGLATLVNNMPNQMSGGQQQRVAIARALVNQPELILADEPTGALDSATGYEIMTSLQELHRTQKVSMVIVTHERDIAEFCQRIITMRDGKILSEIRK